MEAINYAYPELKATTLQHNDLRFQPKRQDIQLEKSQKVFSIFQYSILFISDNFKHQ